MHVTVRRGSGGRPRTPIGTHGATSVRHRGSHFVAETRFRDLDGRLRKVNLTATSRSVLLGSALRIGEALALRICDIDDTPQGMILHVRGTVVLRTGQGAVRQNHPKIEQSVRSIGLPEFGAAMLRRRIAALAPGDPERTVFTNRT